ncbi:protein transport protein sec31-like [Macadamia integrifolia]|uniref:protein transport protein sec31-like n=1 Tax=Macadamia integrifolia TaxID=60698 RepID=UPI001C4FADDC|nr:protein transport protein sec31-like [Macadamia integrifolia]
MNSSQFMDKQILGLSGSQNNDFLELLNPQEEQNGGSKKEEILPSYDFQPIRPAKASQSINQEGSNIGGARVWSSADSRTDASNIRNYVSLDPNESAKVTLEKDRSAYDAATVSEIDRTMKKHADNLLQALEGVSARLSQLESRTHHLESSVDDLKVSVGNNLGSTDGKLRQLENILREVQTGVQVVRDKQEIAEAHLQLTKLQVSNVEQQPENQTTTVQTDLVQQTASAPQQSHQLLPPAASLQQPTQPLPPAASLQQSTQPLPPLPPNAPPSPLQSQQNLPPAQLPIQLPQNQMPSNQPREPYFPPPVQAPEATHQQYQLPPTQQSQPPPQPPHQHYQPTTQLPQYSQLPQPPQQPPPMGPVHPPQLQPPLSHHTEEATYMPSQSYPPSIRQPPSIAQPPSGSPPNQQFYGGPAHGYEPPPSKPSSGFSPAYGPTSGLNYNDSYPYSGSPSHYGASVMKPSQHSAPSAPGGGSSYPRLPTAQILPHALPTATGVGGSSSSSSTGNRVPVDDVVDKVATMGFSREQVRATVRKLTENGQSVDLNVVLDKLMNDGEVQPQKGWYGR